MGFANHGTPHRSRPRLGRACHHLVCWLLRLARRRPALAAPQSGGRRPGHGPHVRRIVVGLLCIPTLLCSVLLVLLVPSSAWADDTDQPGSSESALPSDGSSLAPPEQTPVPDPIPSSSPTQSGTGQPLPEPPSPSPATPQVPTDSATSLDACGSPIQPCTVELPAQLVALMTLVGGLLVLTTSATMVTLWGR